MVNIDLWYIHTTGVAGQTRKQLFFTQELHIQPATEDTEETAHRQKLT